jgi:hypothetical protein
VTRLTNGGGRAIAVDGMNVYWTNAGCQEVTKVPAGAGALTMLGGGAPISIALDATSVYWTKNGADMVMKYADRWGHPRP